MKYLVILFFSFSVFSKTKQLTTKNERKEKEGVAKFIDGTVSNHQNSQQKASEFDLITSLNSRVKLKELYTLIKYNVLMAF